MWFFLGLFRLILLVCTKLYRFFAPEPLLALKSLNLHLHLLPDFDQMGTNSPCQTISP